MTRQEFLTNLSRLQREYESSDSNVNCIGSEKCIQCISCMFCHDCQRCYKSTHSIACSDSSFLVHCRQCTACYSSAYCEESDKCTNSNYLVQCTSCTECNYCFGCVGLEKRDFHILNQPYSRTEYFKITQALRRDLGLKSKG